MKQLRQQQGFTMIELIMVIVILGVLSAFALPRFADLGQSARIAAMQGLAGSMKSAIGITRAQVFASGANSNAATGTVTLDDATVNLVYGYPSGVGASPGILVASGIDVISTLAADTNTFINGDYTYLNDGGVLTIYPTSQTNCVITYTEAADASTAPAIDTTAINTTNC